MKRTLLFLLMLICFFSTYSQKNKKEIYYQYKQKELKHDLKFHTQVDWITENENEWGSFMWCVIRTYNSDKNGNYWYYVYFYSNSFFNKVDEKGNYQKAITYISDIHIYMTEYNLNGKPIVVYDYHKPYIICDHHEYLDPSLYVAFFSSKSKINTFKIKFDKCYPFHDTKIKK
ncbi:MAG: hypothetical protein HPY57_15080 [Ignavibacteria bacterium]|nr:hypothetical protein [Ignavibacteria bacterium]